jgi:hypothetical protein
MSASLGEASWAVCTHAHRIATVEGSNNGDGARDCCASAGRVVSRAGRLRLPARRQLAASRPMHRRGGELVLQRTTLSTRQP